MLQAKALEQMRQMVLSHARSIESYLNEHVHLLRILALSQPALRQVQRCASITQKMLQFGRKQEPQPEQTDLAPRLREIIGLMQRQAGVRNIELALEVEEGLPRVTVDPVELEQVLVNLINNSFDACRTAAGSTWARGRRTDASPYTSAMMARVLRRAIWSGSSSRSSRPSRRARGPVWASRSATES
jgi:signal transduction histidine kinase